MLTHNIFSNFFKNRSLTTRLVFWQILTVILFSTFAITITDYYIQIYREKELKHISEDYAVFIHDNLKLPVWKLDTTAIENICKAFMKNEHISSLKLLSTNGNTLFEESKGGDGFHLSKRLDLVYEGNLIGEIQLAVSYQEEHTEQLDAFLSSLMLVALVALGLILVNRFILKRQLEFPLEYLVERIQDLHSGKYKKGAIELGKEFDLILKKFDKMSAAVYAREKDLKNEMETRTAVEREKLDLEVQLRQSYKMEAIGTLAGGIAHDFNNLLGVILGYSELVMLEVQENSSVYDSLDKIHQASERAKELVKQILTFSRQSDMELFPVDISPICKESIKLLRSSIPTTISIVEEINTENKKIMANTVQIQQIVMNLCTNAYHSMSDGGELTVKVFYQPFDKTEQNISNDSGQSYGCITILVKDTGSGIDPSIHEKIFDPFFTTKEVGRGTGMGLSIIHGIVNEFGGEIRFDSVLGEGTTFKITFPVVAGENRDERTELSESPLYLGRLLVVDDEELLATMTNRMLSKLGYQVTAVTSSTEALSLFQQSPDRFDAVITDQTMPTLTGLELTKRIIKIRPDIPVVLCTGFSNKVDEATAKLAGVREFAFKPVTKNMLVKILNNVLKQEDKSKNVF